MCSGSESGERRDKGPQVNNINTTLNTAVTVKDSEELVSKAITVLRKNETYVQLQNASPKRGAMLKAAYSFFEGLGWGQKEDGSLTTEEKTAIRDAIACCDKSVIKSLLEEPTTRVLNTPTKKRKWSAERGYHLAGSLRFIDTKNLTPLECVEYGLGCLQEYKGNSQGRLNQLRNALCSAVVEYLKTVMVKDHITGVSSPDWKSVAQCPRARNAMDAYKFLFPHSGNVSDWLLPEERKARANALAALRQSIVPIEPTVKPPTTEQIVASGLITA